MRSLGSPAILGTPRLWAQPGQSCFASSTRDRRLLHFFVVYGENEVDQRRPSEFKQSKRPCLKANLPNDVYKRINSHGFGRDQIISDDSKILVLDIVSNVR